MMPRSRGHAGAAFVTAGVMLLLTSATAAEVPSWIASSETEETGRPLWVSAEEAAPNGFLRWELFDAHQQDWIRQNLEQNAKARSEHSGEIAQQRCMSQIITPGAASRRWSPKEILERADVVYSARIEAVAPGFLNGNPGTMIEASVRKVLKKPSEGPPLNDFFVFYHYAEIPIENDYLCARDARKPAPPKTGGLLVLASRDPRPDWAEQNIFAVTDTELFFDSKDGELSAPYAYGKLELAVSALEEALRLAGR